MDDTTVVVAEQPEGWSVAAAPLFSPGRYGMPVWIERRGDPETPFDLRAERLRVRMAATAEELLETGEIEGITEQVILVPTETADFIAEQAIHSDLSEGEFVELVMRLYRDTPSA